TFTTTRLIFAGRLADPNWRIFDLGGPAGNVLWAAVCFVLQRVVRGPAAKARLFLWASMGFSLFWEAGYLIRSGVSGNGDPMALVEGLLPRETGQVLLVVAGLVLFRAVISLVCAESRYVLNWSAPRGLRRAVALLVTLCAGATLVACAGPYLDPRGKIEMLNSGAMSTVPAWVGFAFVVLLLARQNAPPVATGECVRRSAGVIVLAVVVPILFVAVLGPGIHVRV
ncbi:MAG TPA: hypothetical protein VGC88_06040, partial [Terriglobales bacterium]